MHLKSPTVAFDLSLLAKPLGRLRSPRARTAIVLILGLTLGVLGRSESARAIGVAPTLGTAGDFAVLGGSTVTNTGPTILVGSLGVSPGSAIVGFPPGVVVDGTIHAADAVAAQAQLDTTTAYNALAGQACDDDLTGQDLGGMTLGPGVYCFSSSAFLTGTLTLDAEGDPDSVFIFQIGTTLITAPGSDVEMINDGQFCNVFWQVGSSATLDTTTDFIGNILALQSITLNTGATLQGRALARNGAVTLDSNVVTRSLCDDEEGPDIDLDLVKTDAPDPVIAGNLLTYVLTVTNNGSDPAPDVSITDNLPPGTEFVSATPSAGGVCVLQAGNIVRCDWAGDTPPGGSRSVTIVVRVCSSVECGTVLVNTSVAASGSNTDSATASTTVQTQSNLSITKSAPATVVAGANFTYLITVSNLGPSDSQNVVVTDLLPANVQFVSATPSQGSCSAVGQTVTCNLGPLGAPVQCAPAIPTQATISLVVRMCPGTACGVVVNNTATVAGGTPGCLFQLPDPVPGNNASTPTATTVQTQSNLSVSKTGTPNPVVPGSNLTYNIVVTNAGPSNSVSTIVTDILPAQTTFVSATPSQGTCSHVAGVVTCNLGTVGAPNQCGPGGTFPLSATIELVVLVDADTPSSETGCFGLPLSNTVSVTGGNPNCLTNLPDPVPGNNLQTVLTQVRAGSDVEIEPAEFLTGECVLGGDVIQVTHTFSNTGPDAFTPQPDNPGPEFIVNLPANVVGIPGSCVVLQGGGTCVITANTVTWNGSIPVGGVVQLTYQVRILGGLAEFTEICFTGEVNYAGCNALNDATRTATSCILVDCPPTVNPNQQLGAQVHLPILNFLGQNDVCRSWIEVQNIGREFSKAALVVWGEPGFCPPQCAGPLKVECSGLLKPGSTWNFIGSQIPSGAKSGMLFSFTARQLSQIGVNLGFDDIVADYMCETLFFGVVGDCDDFRRFKKAFNEGLDFAGVPLDRALGSALAVEVLRHCPGDLTPGAEVSSKYGGIAGSHLGMYDPVFGGFSYYVPLIYADNADFNTIIYIQNGGIECSSVEIWFQAQDDCLRARICEIFALAPGESFQFDASDCVGPDFQGSAWLRSSQPMGIAVDIFGRDVLMTYIGEPSEINYTFDPDAAFFSQGNQVAFGPLVYSEYQGWDSGIQVQNLSGTLAAKVKVYFLDRSGGVVSTLVDWICPRGSQTFFLPVIANLPGSWVGSVRVESQEWFAPGGPLMSPPNIVGIAMLVKYIDATRSDTAEAIAYNLLPEHKAFDWQIASRSLGGTHGGVGLIAVPSLIKDLDGTGVTTELAITNLVPKPGFTDFAIYIYDQNGLLDYVCQKLNERQVEYIDFDTWGYLNSGFKGSAVISATFWEHDVFDGSGFFLRNLLGLGAVVVERTGTTLGQDIPGDEAAGTTGIAFREDEATGFGFDFEGPVRPFCPGQPGSRPDPLQCPETATLSCTDCPLPIVDLQTTESFINISVADIPAACRVDDVDVLIDLSHTFNGDLIVDLSNPVLADVPMFSGICAATDNIQAILDDEAAQSIGSVCPPLAFERWNTAPPGNLTLFEGESANGTWRLDIFDQFGADQGTLNNWELQFRLRQ